MSSIFIRKRGDQLREGSMVKAKSLRSGKLLWWVVSKPTTGEIVLKRKDETMRISSGCRVLLPLSDEPNLSAS